jgi:hypothetical protein
LLDFRWLHTVPGDVGFGVLGPHHLAEHPVSVLRAYYVDDHVGDCPGTSETEAVAFHAMLLRMSQAVAAEIDKYHPELFAAIVDYQRA